MWQVERQQLDTRSLPRTQRKTTDPRPQVIPMGFHVANKKPVELNVGRVSQIPACRTLEPSAPWRQPGPVTEILQEIVADCLAVAQILQLPLQSGPSVHRSWRVAGIARCLHLTESETVRRCRHFRTLPDRRPEGWTRSFSRPVRPARESCTIDGLSDRPRQSLRPLASPRPHPVPPARVGAHLGQSPSRPLPQGFPGCSPCPPHRTAPPQPDRPSRRLTRRLTIAAQRQSRVPHRYCRRSLPRRPSPRPSHHEGKFDVPTQSRHPFRWPRLTWHPTPIAQASPPSPHAQNLQECSPLLVPPDLQATTLSAEEEEPPPALVKLEYMW